MRVALLVVTLLFIVACATKSAPDGGQSAVTIAVPSLDFPAEVLEKRTAELETAKRSWEADPDDPDALIWYGRRLGYLGRYAESIDVFTTGIRRHPNDARMYRHRGHRFITLREFDRAIADLSRAAELVRGKADEVEPDGLPNARNIPTSTLQSNIHYHLGLAHYLKGEFGQAEKSYRDALVVSKNPDGLVSTSHWLYMTLRRLGKDEDARQLLAPISRELDVIENGSYHQLLLMYRGEVQPEDLLTAKSSDLDRATVGYGVGNWYLYNGNAERARAAFEEVLATKQWSSFGYIAAETELARPSP